MRPELEDTQAAPEPPGATATLGARGAPALPGEDLPPGLQLEHFRIERKLGAGGMGEVYLATDLALDRPVAIKLLPPGAATGAARERLIREARAQARVQHPNVAHIYYIGEDGGRLFFAMEYIAGKTLADAVAAGPLSVDDALDAIHAAALGLREAQRSGFTHRDVKPSNLMVDGNGHVKVLDFGLAASAPADDPGDGPVQQTTLAGTPLYMAPEQQRGEPIDLRCDIYALGATLYHLVSGKPPFQAATVEQLATMHRTAARPTLPRGGHPRTAVAAVDTLVSRMMATAPGERFASYDELLRAIELASATRTRPAGLWVRTIAFGIDALVATLLAAAIVLGAKLATSASINIDHGIIPMIAVMQTLLVARWGSTAGKALFELEVVSIRTARKPALRQALVRSLALYGLPILGELATWLARLAPDPAREVIGLVGQLPYLVVFFALVHAALRTPGKRAPWDRIAGTMVRYRTPTR
ncbi:MAG TPA: protein kinase [Kofleriaceae bacterium]|nr:protein kinase [Kofleriaceae bacterium]